MVKWIILAIFAFFLASFEANFLSFFIILQALPDLILIASFLILLCRNFNEAIFFAFWGALYLELFSVTPINFSSVAIILSISVTSIIVNFFERENPFSIFILAGIVSIFNEFFIISQLLIIGHSGLVSLGSINYALSNYIKFWLLEISYNVILIFLIYVFIGKFRRIPRRLPACR